MSSESENNEDESQMETQALDTLQDEVEEEEHETLEDAQEQEEDQADDAVEVPDPKPRIPHPKKTRKEPGDVVREPGKSLLPHSKVHSIIKADTQIPIVARDATFLISIVTEEFIKQLCEAGHQVAQKEKRTTVQHRDIAAVVRRAGEFMFLEDIMHWSLTDSAPKKPKPKAKLQDSKAEEEVGMHKGMKATTLDQFVKKKDDVEDDDGDDIVMDEDGAMYAAGPSESDRDFE